MNWFRNLGITRKLAVAFTLTTAMTLALGAFALIRLSEANAQLLDISSNWMPAVQSLGEMRAQLGEYRTYEQAQLGKQGDAAAIADYDKRMADTYRRIVDAKKQYDAIDAASLPEETALEQKIESGLKPTSVPTSASPKRLRPTISIRHAESPARIPGSHAATCSMPQAAQRPHRRAAGQERRHVQTGLPTHAHPVRHCPVRAGRGGGGIGVDHLARHRPPAHRSHAGRARDCGRQARRCAPGRRQGRDRRPAAFDAGHARRAARFAEESQRMARLHAGEDISHRMPEDFPAPTTSWWPAPTTWSSSTWTPSSMPSACSTNTPPATCARRAAPARPARHPARVDGRGQGQPGGDARQPSCACPKRPPTATSRCARMPASSSIRSAKW
jgi:hypothetical protein